MKKFINSAETMVAESLQGFVRANSDLVVFGTDRKYVRRRELTHGKVALISGGGAGHEPMHVGFIGQGMLDAACTGHVFTSATPEQIVSAIDDVDTGAGCLLVVKNYDGDLMNFEMAMEMASSRHTVEMIVVHDDVEEQPGRGRRGVAGTLVVEKLLGAAAERDMSLPDLVKLGLETTDCIRSMGVALSGVTVPHTQRRTFSLDATEIEIGVGIHGEPGHSREPFANCDTIIERLCSTILADIRKPEDMTGLLFVNGLGSTPPAELYLAYNSARNLLEKQGVSVGRSLVGTYVTSLDMQGLSVTLALLTREQTELWDFPVKTPSLRWG